MVVEVVGRYYRPYIAMLMDMESWSKRRPGATCHTLHARGAIKPDLSMDRAD